ncbi:hypothetical protein JCM8547_004323 [Rhodosporidiobolus lusitaniae]
MLRLTRTTPKEEYNQEADAFFFVATRNDAVVRMGTPVSEVVGSKDPIRPNAPWPVFLAARLRVLQAFHAFERSTSRSREIQPNGVEEGDDVKERVGRAFKQLSLALDRVTVPHCYWSDLPHEDVTDETNHAALVAMLEDLEKRFLHLASPTSSLPSSSLSSPLPPSTSDSTSLASREAVNLLELLEAHTEVFLACPPCRLVARTTQSEVPAWPHDGSYSRV